MSNKKVLVGFSAAIFAVVLWSGNFIVARGLAKSIPPVQLSLLRWCTASILLLPFAYAKTKQQWNLIIQHRRYLLGTAFIGISLFNTLLYFGGHYTQAINLAIIGTSASPVFSTFLAAIFLKEKIGIARITGMLLCLWGVLFLMTKGNWQHLQLLKFSTGDIWVFLSALLFAVYTIMVKKKPAPLDATVFLFTIITAGTLLLIPLLWIQPFFLQQKMIWTPNTIWIILYLGLGASVLAYLSWNKAIPLLGAARTALLGNLIPVLSTVEAVIFLGEAFSNIHLISSIIIIAGIIIANLPRLKKEI
ncbi:MAG: DMT family transporter [Hydrotalea flava]|uniref:DMT family transporter n=1 Tax=Hydrotalea lipotrueae TaxID=2803817 RepID=UPI001C483E58|nr:DMT family transporter [Hydrotalea lipotrueae]MBY0348125.1 DMT family transporter [Hydrotalea flava]